MNCWGTTQGRWRMEAVGEEGGVALIWSTAAQQNERVAGGW